MARTWIQELDEYPTGAKRRKILSMAVLASLICSYEAAIAPVVPLLLHDLNMTLTTYGLISAIALLCGGVAGFFGGRLADRYGRVRVLLPIMALTAFLALAMAFVTTATEFAVLRFVLTFADGMAIATTAPLVRDFSPRMGRAQALGFWTCGPVGANFLSAGIAAVTLPLFNNAWHSQFLIIGVLSLIASIVIALNIADLSPRLRAEVLHSEQRVIEAADTREPARAATLLTNRTILAHVIGIAVWLSFYISITAFGQTMLTQTFQRTPAAASMIMACFWVLNIVSLIVVGRWSDKLQLRRIFTCGFTLVALVVLAVFGYLMGRPDTSNAALMLTGALMGGAMGAAVSPWMANYSENSEDIDARLQGTTWGLYNLVVKGVGMVTLLVAPQVAHHSSWQVWIMITWVCMALFLVAMTRFKGPFWPRDVGHLQLPAHGAMHTVDAAHAKP
ncbi:hypothetical protein CCO03_09660 [Comamonas serinivorans]|uniref:Major facilitator superfamily (MFS) profile domain-containing protein n=1 Tax=Comamonas serinivorans TaxID=1082851 RepID=A0A1Y0EMM7_9BURK|nr:MFS transporter [Comamonas serinivorans]ARU04914.1 hypothetical protein CCO03_09660 [Comamonas serinivorans]